MKRPRASAAPDMLNALKACEQILQEASCVADFDKMTSYYRELSNSELGRLWIETGRAVQAAIAKAEGR